MIIKPLSDKVLLKAITTPETTKGGIIIPENAAPAEAGKAEEAEVLAVGNGRLQMDGSVMPLITKKGDRVLYINYGGNEVTIEGEDCILIEEHSILAILES
ncbi:MAG: co-chaperone GroES [Deltaproteobacteria bacterium]|nr:co-chaperone GroES [Deltaproteobacteria bacterium]